MNVINIGSRNFVYKVVKGFKGIINNVGTPMLSVITPVTYTPTI